MKELLKKSPVICAVMKKLHHFYYNRLLSMKCDLALQVRKHLFCREPYKQLRQYHNLYEGKRCFIVATGPSLTTSDLEELKDEITFSMNSICLSFDETTWRPTYYGIQDINVYEKLQDKLKDLALPEVFVSDHLAKTYSVPGSWHQYPIHFLNHYYRVAEQKVDTKFSDYIPGAVYDGYSISYSLLQIAAYMGFKEIYLLGADCNYEQKGATHFKEYGFKDPNALTVGEKMIYAYEVAKKYADAHEIKIYNATRGGKLEVFERVDLDQVVAKKGSEYEK